MSTPSSILVLISLVSAISAVVVSIVTAMASNRNNIILQTRKLKEDHYVSFIEALHDFAAANTNNEAVKKFTFARDKLLIIACEDVVVKLLLYEEATLGKSNELHDAYLTEL